MPTNSPTSLCGPKTIAWLTGCTIPQAADLSGWDQNLGTSPAGMVKALEAMGWLAEAYSGPNVNLGWLRHCLQEGKGVILDWWQPLTGVPGGHYVALLAVSESAIEVWDSDLPDVPRLAVLRQFFEANWFDYTNSWELLVRPCLVAWQPHLECGCGQTPFFTETDAGHQVVCACGRASTIHPRRLAAWVSWKEKWVNK